jgi:hypothetical protein
MFAYFTLFTYLLVGSMAVRLLSSHPSHFTLSLPAVALLETTVVAEPIPELAEVPAISFAAMPDLPVKPAVAASPRPAAIAVALELPLELEQISHFTAANELPFHEPVKVRPVVFNGSLMTNLVALYQNLPRLEETAMLAQSMINEPADAMMVTDEVSTQVAKSAAPAEDDMVEPEFFDYADEQAPVTAEVDHKEMPVPTVTDYSELTDIQQLKAAAQSAQTQGPAPKSEVVSIDDLVVFNHAQAKQAVTTQQIPTVSSVKPPTSAPKPSGSGYSANKPETAEQQQGFLPNFPSSMTIQLVATDLKQTQKINGFEVRFQDDLTLIKEDFGTGEVNLQENLAQPKMTRAITVLKRGYAPTNTDLILEDGQGAVSLPLIEERTFNKLLSPFTSRGPMGAVLIELDDETDSATLDAPYGRMYNLNGELQKTQEGSHRYLLFVGVKAGNALLSYRTFKGETVSKIIHVHEHEVTFESNFFEKDQSEVIQLFEEDLLAKEIAPLIIGGEQVQIFATNKTAKKLDDHNYKLDFGAQLLAGRRYTELTHQSEPIFVGVRENTKVIVPSENFMRFVLSRFEGAKLGNRCLVQVNLSKKVIGVDVGSESVASALVTQIQMLDNDGKFYDSAGDKTRKIIVVGENQGAAELSQDGKINLKISYQDGTSQYLSSYCSPNTYLVEQL